MLSLGDYLLGTSCLLDFPLAFYLMTDICASFTFHVLKRMLNSILSTRDYCIFIPLQIDKFCVKTVITLNLQFCMRLKKRTK